MVYILVLSAILIGFIKNKSNIVFLAMLLLIWLMLGWSSENADYMTYLKRFSNFELYAVYTEALYTLLMRWGNNSGLTYQQFLPLLMLTYVGVICFITKNKSKAPAFTLALYMIFPACMEAVQVRYTLASAFVLLGCYFLFNKEDRYGEAKFSLLVILAMLIHLSTIVFFLLLLEKRLNTRSTILYTISISIAIYLSRMSFVINLLSKLPGMADKISRVLAGSANRYTTLFVIEIACHCLVSFSFFMFLSYKLKKWSTEYQPELDISYINTIQKVNIISLVILPLLFYSADFYRIQQTLSLLNYCALSYYVVILPNIKKSKHRKLVTTKKRVKFVLGCTVMTILNLYFIVLKYNYYTVFEPFFENNLLFGRCK